MPVAARALLLRVALLCGILPALAQQPRASVQDWSSLRLSLTRDPGFCACIFYTVEIQGGGEVWLQRAREPRARVGRLDRSELQQLLDRLLAAGFFGLDDEYGLSIIDEKMATISLALDGKRHSILVHDGERGGAPKFLLEVVKAIEQAVGPQRWGLAP